MPQVPNSDSSRSGVPVMGTRLESADEIRHALQARKPAVVATAVPTAVPVFRPTRRPSMALLCILDDGRDDGEWLRLRSDRVVIGRSEGDIVIPHDTMMSARHAELGRQVIDGRSCWVLTDLQSTNGTFVRVGNALLKLGQEMLIGSKRYCFQVGSAATGTAVDEGPRGTQGWQAVTPAELQPALVELTMAGEGPRYPLTAAETWIGSDPTQSAVVLANDSLVNPRHLRIYKDKKSRWHVENTHSVNGVWLRVQQLPVEGTCQFQLGEQRFVVGTL